MHATLFGLQDDVDDSSYISSQDIDGQSCTDSSSVIEDSFLSRSSRGSLTSEHTGSSSLSNSIFWVPPATPPSPPLQYDPRCRLESPDTPSPLFRKQLRPTKSTKVQLETNKQSPDTYSGHTLFEHSEPHHYLTADHPSLHAVSPSLPSSWTLNSGPPASNFEASASSYTSAYGSGSHTSIASTISLWPRPSSSRSTQSSLQPTAASSSTAFSSFNPVSYLTRRTRTPLLQPQLIHSSSSSDHRKLSLGLTFRPARTKLSSFREPSTNTKPKIKPPGQHHHKRSISVQWQQIDRWRSKFRAILTYIAVLLGLLSCMFILLYKLSAFTKFSSKPYTHLSRLDLSHLEQPQRDSIAIYRIIGNDLPPRHGEGQTLRSLRFMLTQENDFSFLSSPASTYGLKVEKYYVLNRLTSSTSIDPILALLDEFGVPRDRVLTIPFDWLEYQKHKLKWNEGVVSHENLWGIGSDAQGSLDYSIQKEPLS